MRNYLRDGAILLLAVGLGALVAAVTDWLLPSAPRYLPGGSFVTGYALWLLWHAAPRWSAFFGALGSGVAGVLGWFLYIAAT